MTTTKSQLGRVYDAADKALAGARERLEKTVADRGDTLATQMGTWAAAVAQDSVAVDAYAVLVPMVDDAFNNEDPGIIERQLNQLLRYFTVGAVTAGPKGAIALSMAQELNALIRDFTWKSGVFSALNGEVAATDRRQA